jgi:hypothetical protein
MTRTGTQSAETDPAATAAVLAGELAALAALAASS